jgi:hypothetical protein
MKWDVEGEPGTFYIASIGKIFTIKDLREDSVYPAPFMFSPRPIPLPTSTAIAAMREEDLLFGRRDAWRVCARSGCGRFFVIRYTTPSTKQYCGFYCRILKHRRVRAARKKLPGKL